MIFHIKRKEIIVALNLCLSLSFSNCTRPEDNALNKKEDSIIVNIVPEKKGPEVHTIEIDLMKFQPNVINAHIGDTIVWINKDLVDHCVTEESHNTWTSSKIPHDSLWSLIVTESCDYYCAIHKVMKGKIAVE